MTWEEYKKQVIETDPIAGEIIKQQEVLSPIIGEIMIRQSELGLSDHELAERCGVSEATIRRMETGGVIPTMDTLIKVCRCVGLRLMVEREEIMR